MLLPPPLLDLLPDATLTATTVVWLMELALITFVRLVGVGGPLRVVSGVEKTEDFCNGAIPERAGICKTDLCFMFPTA